MLSKKLVFVIFILFFLVAGSVFIWKFSKEKEITDAVTTLEPADSPFAKKDNPSKLLNDAIVKYKDVSFVPERDLVSIKIESYDASLNKVYGEVTWPPNLVKRQLDSFISCDLSDYKLRKFSGNNLPPTFEDLTFEQVIEGISNNTYLSFSGYCSDAECASFIKNCIVH